MNRVPGSAVALSRVFACVLFLAGSASAQQDWPNRSIRVITGAGPAGTPTLTARIVTEPMSQSLGQPIVVDPRVGAGGNLAADLTAKAAPDGYTFMLATNGSHGIAPSLYQKLPFDSIKDFAGVAKVVEVPTFLFAIDGLKVRTVQELVAYAKANPGKLNYASVGAGSFSHLAGVMFERSADIRLIHVPYKTTVEMLPAIAAGEIHVAFLNARAAKGAIPLAIASQARDELLPVPTFTELGLKNIELTQWYGFVTAAKTPQPIVERFAAEVQRALRNPELVKRLAGVPAVPAYLGPRAFESFYHGEIAQWAVVVKASGATAD